MELTEIQKQLASAANDFVHATNGPNAKPEDVAAEEAKLKAAVDARTEEAAG